MTKHLVLKDKETGLFWVGYSHTSWENSGWRSRPRVFTKSGLASSISGIMFSGQWLEDYHAENPPPPHSLEGKSNPEYWEWFRNRGRLWKQYVKDRGGVLNALPDNCELIEIKLPE